jgi:hypothetical protein
MSFNLALLAVGEDGHRTWSGGVAGITRRRAPGPVEARGPRRRRYPIPARLVAGLGTEQVEDLILAGSIGSGKTSAAEARPKEAVLDMKATLDRTDITNQDAALRQAAGQAFYNTSPFTLRDLRARASQRKLRDDFVEYLDGFSGMST